MMKFNKDGLLPPGDYELTLNKLRDSILVNGPKVDDLWDVK